VADPARATGYLTQAGYEVTADEGYLIVEGHEHPEALSRLLAGHGLYVAELTALRANLESFYLKLTGHLPPRSEDAGEAADPAVEPDDPAARPLAPDEGGRR
jgi:hypothetical protein